MHTSTTVRLWMHHFHDGSVKAAHYTGHLFHEKAFWSIVVILALITGLFTLIAFNGNDTTMQNYYFPYGPYF
jgi:hypothetical protein